MRIIFLSPQGENSLAKTRQVTGGGCAKTREAQKRDRVYEKILPFPPELAALTQESPISLPNKSGHNLDPAPDNWAKEQIPLPSPSEQPCVSGHNMHTPSPFLCGKCYDSNLINWPERYLLLYSSIQAGEERDTVTQQSKFCPSCQTSVYPDSPCVSVFKSSSHHFLGTGPFYILDISQPVSLQLS